MFFLSQESLHFDRFETKHMFFGRLFTLTSYRWLENIKRILRFLESYLHYTPQGPTFSDPQNRPLRRSLKFPVLERKPRNENFIGTIYPL